MSAPLTLCCLQESRFGYPFTFVIRDILQFDADLDATITRLGDTARTCDLILGAGDANMKTFRSFEVRYSTQILCVLCVWCVMCVVDRSVLCPCAVACVPSLTALLVLLLDA